ncbi:hypothetical protein BGZ95_000951 [Linnemannia exigua]|uniref:F-box domain-containing protein n=1 Tax=Linnemannia exigua TaxID=604196 RepID=A0AAD4H9S7_9FUNG|nr:hypothetical protein BGZ95_000951 [Linnemannia exigua]
MAFFKTLFTKPTKTETSTKHHHHHSPSLLDIPEILDLIFSYLDDFTIRRYAALVCQQWCRVSQNRLFRSVVCDSTWTKSWQDATIAASSSRMIGAGRLLFSISVKHANTESRYIVDYKEDVRTALSTIQNEYWRQAEQRRQALPTLYKFSPLKDLHLDISTNCNIHALDGYLVPINTLTTFVLTCRHKDSTCKTTASLSNILLACPALEFFEARSLTPGLDLSWTSFAAEQQEPFPLRSLIIANAFIKQESIENLLLLTPRIKVLHLIGMSLSAQAGYNWSHLAILLSALPIVLDQVHFSTQEQQLPQKIQQQLFRVCSGLSEWHLWAPNTTPSLLKDMAQHTNRLTTLVLYTSSNHTRGNNLQSELTKATTVLHRFLSTSDDLVHLKTLKTAALLQDLDIHRRRGYIHLLNPDRDIFSSYISEGPKSFAVWRCRGLQTLHLEVHGAWESSLEGSVQSRIVFGYVSRVFPVLEELSVTMPSECSIGGRGGSYEPRIRFELEGGLCLLSRLKCLQRLEVRCGDMKELMANVKEVSLNWMIPAGHNSKFRRKRKKEVAQWRERRGKEDALEAFRLQRQKGQEHVDRIKTLNGSGDAKLLGQLQYLGLLRDVEEVVKEMGSTSYCPLPCLEGLAIRRFYFAQPKEEIEFCLPPKPERMSMW